MARKSVILTFSIDDADEGKIRGSGNTDTLLDIFVNILQFASIYDYEWKITELESNKEVNNS